MLTIIALAFIVYLYRANLPDTTHFKAGIFAGAGLVFAAHYLITTWFPALFSILDRLFGIL